MQARRFEVPVHDQHALAPARQQARHVGECHGAAGAALVGIKRDDAAAARPVSRHWRSWRPRGSRTRASATRGAPRPAAVRIRRTQSTGWRPLAEHPVVLVDDLRDLLDLLDVIGITGEPRRRQGELREVRVVHVVADPLRMLSPPRRITGMMKPSPRPAGPSSTRRASSSLAIASYSRNAVPWRSYLGKYTTTMQTLWQIASARASL